MLVILFSLAIAMVNGAENPYYYLTNSATAVELPVKLVNPITAIYGDTLYVFGGTNESLTGSNTIGWNNQFWSLSLSDFTLSNSNTQVTTALTTADWSPITNIVAPTYGASTDNTFACSGQCSVVIGAYLYIVGPYAESSEAVSDIDTIYRLDLSATPPVFASDTEFTKNTLGYAGTARDPCVTATMGKMYTMTGTSGSTLAGDTVEYDPNATPPTQTAKDTLVDSRRFAAGCAANLDGDGIYLFGGKSKTSRNAISVDSFDITANSWTTSSANEFDLDSGTSMKPDSRRQMKCVRLGYQNNVECVSGYYTSTPVADSIVWDIDTRTEEYVNLQTAVSSSGVQAYEFVSTADYKASIILVLGGADTDEHGVVSIQYAVRYFAITDEPSKSPSNMPSGTPSKMPIRTPSKSPSKSPLCEGCTRAPTATITTTVKTDSGNDATQRKVAAVIVVAIFAMVWN